MTIPTNRKCPNLYDYVVPYPLPTQLGGVRFMWSNLVYGKIKEWTPAKGSGCILAHAMGLGKTLQVGYSWLGHTMR